MARVLASSFRISLGFILGAIAGTVFSILVTSAFAHDHKRPDLDWWYPTLHSKGGKWCCDGPKKDALHLRDVDWESRDGKYRVRIPVDIDSLFAAIRGETVEMIWADVPEDAVIEQPNMDGQTLVWPSYGYEGPKVRCFMPGSMT
jgi:hypothetical protein